MKQQQCYVKLNGHRVCYSATGEGPPLLLIHGLSGSGAWWRRNIPALQPHFSVYSVDLVGFGRSRRLRPLPLADAADLLADLIVYLGYSSADVVAHSMGGLIALLLAAHHPQRIERLVLAAAATGRAMQASIWQMMHRATLASLGMLDFMPTVLWDSLRAGPLGLWVAANELLLFDLQQALTTIQTPTLLIYGERDLIVPPAVGRALHAALPHSELVFLAGAGHVPMHDRAAAFNREVLRFLVTNDKRLPS